MRINVVPFAKKCLAACALMLATLPQVAHADLLADRLKLSMYGRVGLAWTGRGNFIQGQSLNLNGSLGGRFEEGDYLEPALRVHVLKPEEADKPYADLVMTMAMFAKNGLLLGAFSNRFTDTLGMEFFQAYMEAGNVGLPGLKIWGGSRFYRGPDVHIADYFYFNNLSGQGVGVQYGGLDVAVLLNTSGSLAQYNHQYTINVGTPEEPVLVTENLRRQRTVFVGQYKHELGGGNFLHGLAEFHALPGVKFPLPSHTEALKPDFGWVAGVRHHLELGEGSFNDASVRYGSRIASGSRGQSWETFGDAGPNGLYEAGSGFEVVDHFLYNFGKTYSLNAYGILNLAHGGNGTPPPGTGETRDRAGSFVLGARGTYYWNEFFHIVHEVSRQAVIVPDAVGAGPQCFLLPEACPSSFDPASSIADHDKVLGATRLSLVPTFVPSGDRSVWARPHLRLIYTVAFYNQAVQDLAALAVGNPKLQTARYVPAYLRTVGATSVAHYLGARAEWWF